MQRQQSDGGRKGIYFPCMISTCLSKAPVHAFPDNLTVEISIMDKLHIFFSMEVNCLCGQMPTMATAALQLTSLRLYLFGRQPRSNLYRLRSTSRSPDSGSTSSDPPNQALPWTLMGRTVKFCGDHDRMSASDQSQTSDSGIEVRNRH